MTPQRSSRIRGVTVGHAEDRTACSGVTAIVFDAPAVASISVLGGAPGGRDTGLLDPAMTVETVDAFVLSGGSAFGLDAAGGAMSALAARGRGLAVGSARIPIVPQAIVFDLLAGGDFGGHNQPRYWSLGQRAVEAAKADFAIGSAGAGLGATTASLKGGFGTAHAARPDGLAVQAFIAVNAIGSATIGDGPHFWAAPYEREAEFGGRGWPAPFPAEALSFRVKGHAARPATTIGAVATNARLTKPQAARLAIMAQDGLARAIRPAHAAMDGDTIFAAATGEIDMSEPLFDLTELGAMAGDCVARAIAIGVHAATALPVAGALPSWQDRFGSSR